MNQSGNSSMTNAFYVQSILSFAISLAAATISIVYLPVDGWIRAFLGLALLYVVTSAFTLAKCIRDRQEAASIVNRVDQARLDKFLAEHDLLAASPTTTSQN